MKDVSARVLFATFFVLMVGTTIGVRAQTGVGYGVVYRPGPVEYRVLEEGRFEFIYQTGTEDMVRRTARALEGTWKGTKTLVGPVRDDFRLPVIINDFNDRSNGFVHPFPFRSEIETPSIKTDALVARASSWPALVAPHELVHAAQAEVDGTVGVGSLVRPFAPDLARIINLQSPRGLTEGVAVYRESQIEPNSGRLNAPTFQMKMKAAMLSDDPWGLTEMFSPPAYTQPFNRYYIGGGHAFEYLAERGDSTETEFFRSTVTWHNRFPFLGHGVWLALSTGQFPHQIGSEIQAALRKEYEADLERRRPFTSSTTVAGGEGRNYRRPYWVDDDTVVTYAHGYDLRPGFYHVDAKTGRRSVIRVQDLTEDRVYSIGSDSTSLYAGRYVQDALVPRQEVAEVERVTLSDGSATQLSSGGRAFAPAIGAGGEVYAITNDGPFTRWSRIKGDGSTVPVTRDAARSIRQIAPSPVDSTIAVLVNEDGQQRLYRATEPIEEPAQLKPWLAVHGSIIYDVSWGPEGDYLLFSADRGGTPNAYAYEIATSEVLQLTNVPYGALEPALSPDRSAVAYVDYRHEQYALARIPFRPDSATVVPDSLIRHDFRPRRSHRQLDSTGATRELKFRNSRSYSALRHLAPRMIYPTIHGAGDDDLSSVGETAGPESLGTGVGVGLQGTDPIQKWTYRGLTYWQDGRLWGEARFQSGKYLLRPSFSVFDRPFTTIVRAQGESFTAKVEERGGSVGVRLPVTLASNVYRTRLRLGLDTELRQTRFFGDVVSEESFSTRVSVEPTATLAYRVQQNPRDLVPNTGAVLAVRGESDVWSSSRRASNGVIAGLDVYLPILRGIHTGIRLGGRVLYQSRNAVFNTGTFVPRGYSSTTRLPAGPYYQLEAEVTQPVWFIDDGFTLLPFYAKALAVYGFGESLGEVEGRRFSHSVSSVGGGVSFRCRIFYGLDLDFRIGAAYRPGRNDVVTIFR